MDYRKRLKTRLIVAIVYLVLGAMMIAGTFVTKTDNEFISAFGFAMVVIGIVRLRSYRIITRNEDTIKKQQIIETDERTVSIIHKAKSAAFSICIFAISIAVIVLSFISLHEVARWLSCSLMILLVTYWICYFIYQKRM